MPPSQEVINFASHSTLKGESNEEREEGKRPFARKHSIRVGAALLPLRTLIDGSSSADIRKAQNQFLVRGGGQRMFEKWVDITHVKDGEAQMDHRMESGGGGAHRDAPQVYVTLQLFIPEPLPSCV